MSSQPIKRLGTYFVLLLGIIFLVSSCTKQKEFPIGKNPSAIFSDLHVPGGFEWSNTAWINLSVRITDMSGTPMNALDGQPLDLLDMHGCRLQRMVVVSGKVDFSVMLDKNKDKLKIFSPVTGKMVMVSAASSKVNFQDTTRYPASYLDLRDSDGDRIPDIYDDFKWNSRKAFRECFPADGFLTDGDSVNHSGEQYLYQIYEDLWPVMGDYDLNDLVLASKLEWVRNSNNYLVSGNYIGRIWAVGAYISAPYGLGLEFLKREKENLIYLPGGSISLASSESFTHLDERLNNGIVVFDDVFKMMDSYYNNIGGSWGVSGIPKTVPISFTFRKGSRIRNFEVLPYIFCTSNPARQVRPFGIPPTAYADMTIFRNADDYSPLSWEWKVGTRFSSPLKNEEAFYRTAKNLPWVIDFISSDYKVPVEKTSILEAYPEFQKWAESGGTENKKWYDYPDLEKTISVSEEETKRL